MRALAFLSCALVACAPPPKISEPPLPPDPVMETSPSPPRQNSGYLLVSADALEAVADQLQTHRAAQGFAVRRLLASELGSDATGTVRRELTKLRNEHPDTLLFVALLGDAPATPTAGEIPAVRCQNHTTATGFDLTSDTGDCVTDNAYGDIDGDGLPEAAVGRIPARSVEQAQAYLRKLQLHESTYEVGEWNRLAALYTGQGGFGAQTDALLEVGMFEALKRISHAYDIVGIYNNPKSPYYYQPFETKTFELFTDGAVGVTYVGHGSATQTEGLSLSQVSGMTCEHRLPVASFFACTNGRYVGPSDSIAEALLWEPGGPIVTLAAADVSHPLGNATMVYELERSILDEGPASAGEALWKAKRAVLEHDDEFRELVRSVSPAFVPVDQQPLLYKEHINLYNLFGDPATWLKLPPTTVRVEKTGGDFAAGRMEISGRVEGISDGTAIVTLECDRDTILGELEPVDPVKPASDTVQRNWKKAVNKVVTRVEVPVHDGHFDATLEWKPPLPSTRYFAKAYVRTQKRDAIGFALVLE